MNKKKRATTSLPSNQNKLSLPRSASTNSHFGKPAFWLRSNLPLRDLLPNESTIISNIDLIISYRNIQINVRHINSINDLLGQCTTSSGRPGPIWDQDLGNTRSILWNGLLGRSGQRHGPCIAGSLHEGEHLLFVLA